MLLLSHDELLYVADRSNRRIQVFSPDGKFIYFNSERSGTMQIWRMRSDGAEQEQVTSDEFNN